MIKPRIIQVSPGVWECACSLVSQTGATSKQAYDRWLNASLIDAMANLHPIENTEPPPAARSKPVGRPITIKPVPTPLPVVKKQPEYHPSVVHVIPGTAVTKEYRPPAGLAVNLSRAAQSEPKLSPLVSKNLREARRFGL